jgi:hypothetical protein
MTTTAIPQAGIVSPINDHLTRLVSSEAYSAPSNGVRKQPIAPLGPVDLPCGTTHGTNFSNIVGVEIEHNCTCNRYTKTGAQ